MEVAAPVGKAILPGGCDFLLFPRSTPDSSSKLRGLDSGLVRLRFYYPDKYKLLRTGAPKRRLNLDTSFNGVPRHSTLLPHA